MTVNQMKKMFDALVEAGQGDLPIRVSDEYGFDWDAIRVVGFDNAVVIEREE